MSDNLDKYLPEYDENEARKKLAGFSAANLTDLLIRAYKEKRVLARSRMKCTKNSAASKKSFTNLLVFSKCQGYQQLTTYAV